MIRNSVHAYLLSRIEKKENRSGEAFKGQRAKSYKFRSSPLKRFLLLLSDPPLNTSFFCNDRRRKRKLLDFYPCGMRECRGDEKIVILASQCGRI